MRASLCLCRQTHDFQLNSWNSGKISAMFQQHDNTMDQ
jgi:hypothetical protein